MKNIARKMILMSLLLTTAAVPLLADGVPAPVPHIATNPPAQPTSTLQLIIDILVALRVV